MEKSGCLTKSSGKDRLFSKEQWKSQAVVDNHACILLSIKKTL
jgi:hypothetical protein